MIDRETRLRLEAEEHELFLRPEATLRRREFLQRAAYAAGVASAAPRRPANLLLAEAAKNQAYAMPSPSAMPLDHIVVLMMENRSFDHYFGWHPTADAVQARSYPDPQDGNTLVDTRSASTLGTAQWQGCGHPDPDHSWEGGRAQLGSSATNTSVEPDGFLEGVNDEFALTYYDEGDVEFIHAAAQEFALFDAFHCSLMGPTWPNRYYMWSAQSGGLKDNNPPVATGGNQWPTIFDRLNTPRNLARGISAKYYHSDLPFSAVWGPRGVPWTHPVAEYYAACASGTLPSVSFVDPPFKDGGGGDGISADEHPLGDIRLGQAFMSDIVHAFMRSPNWHNGALFIVYDEWGGFFDHVRPPSVSDVRQNTTNMDEDFGLMGYRIPGVVVSPFVDRGSVQHLQCGFESILKLISYRWCLDSLTTRDADANNIGDAMDFANPDCSVPDLPDPDRIVSRPCTLGGGDVIQDGGQSHESDLAALEGLADRFGYSTGSASATEIFQKPDSLKKSLR
jgi:phospholipase C